MATFNTSYYTAQTSTPITATKMAPTPYVIDVEFTTTATTPADGDTINICRLPENHIIIGGAVTWSLDIGAATFSLDIGYAGALDAIAIEIPIGASAGAGRFILGMGTTAGDLAPTSVTGTTDVIATAETADVDAIGIIRFVFLVQGLVPT